MPKVSQQVTEEFFAQLYQSYRTNNIESINTYLASYPDLLKKRNPGDINLRTALHIAVGMNHTVLVSVLLTRGADPNEKVQYPGGYRYDEYRTPLYMAVDRGNLDIARMLLERGAKVDAIDGRNETPLRCAVREHNQEMVDLLLRYKANPHKSCGLDRQTTPLHTGVASRSENRIQLVSSLLRSGGKHKQDGEGVSPIALAARFDDLETFKLLIFNSSYADSEGVTHDFSRWSKIGRALMAREGYTIGPTVAAYIEKLETYREMLPFLKSGKGNYALLSGDSSVREAHPSRIGPLTAALMGAVLEGCSPNAIVSCREVYADMQRYKAMVSGEYRALVSSAERKAPSEERRVQPKEAEVEEGVLHYAAGDDGSLLLTVLALQEGSISVNDRNSAGETPLTVVSKRISKGDASREDFHIWELLKRVAAFSADGVRVAPEQVKKELDHYYDIAMALTDDDEKGPAVVRCWEGVVGADNSEYAVALGAAAGRGGGSV